MVQNTNPGNYIIYRFEDPPKNLGLFCPCAQKLISRQKSFCSLWWVLEVNQQGYLQYYPKSGVCAVTQSCTLGNPSRSQQALILLSFIISDGTALDFNRGRIKTGIVSNPAGQFNKLYVVFTPFYVWQRKTVTSHKYSSWAFHMFLSWWSSEAHSLHMCKQPILKCVEKWIWSQPLFKIPCEASNSSVSWVLLPSDFLKKHRVFLSSRTVHSLVSLGWTSLVC